MDLPVAVKKYYPVLSLAIDMHPVAHSIECGNTYAPRTHVERLRELRRWLLNNPHRLPADVEDSEHFLRILNDMRFIHDEETNRIFIGAKELIAPISSASSSTKHSALAGTITPDLQTANNLSAICYVIHNGLTCLPFLIKDPTNETIGHLTNLQGTYPCVEMLPAADNNLLLI